MAPRSEFSGRRSAPTRDVEMKADQLAKTVLERFQTRNVNEIAGKSGVKVIYEKWFPVTLGELDWKKREIRVNQNAKIDFDVIIAHELGHYFIKIYELKIAGDEETFCDEFADKLLR